MLLDRGPGIYPTGCAGRRPMAVTVDLCQEQRSSEAKHNARNSLGKVKYEWQKDLPTILLKA